MSSIHKTLNCLICKKQLEIMVSLDQTLNQCESLTVAQVLENLHFLNISDLERLGPVLCFICVAKVQSCFDFKSQCYQIGKQLDSENVFIESSEVASLLPEDDMSPNTINNDPLDENSTANDNLGELCEIGKIKEEINAAEIENIVTNIQCVIPETSATISCETKAELDIVENIALVKNDESLTRSTGIDSNEHKGKGNNSHVCDVCNKSFSYRSRLTLHKRIHTGERPYECDVCNKSFIRPFKFIEHQRVHTGERPFACDVCNKSFMRSEYLVKHKRIHIGVRPYVCDVCNKSFMRSEYLYKHKRSHTGEKPYVCDVCSKSFSCLSSFKLHKRGHAGDKPYACHICEKSFVRSANLKQHLLIHSKEKLYWCDVCNKAFRLSYYLMRHKSIHSMPKAGQ